MSSAPRSFPKRWSAKRKTEIVLRLLRGESLDALSKETAQPPSVLAQWRDDFVQGGTQTLKRRTHDPKLRALERERQRLQAKVGELTMVNETLEQRVRRLGGNSPPRRRWER